MRIVLIGKQDLGTSKHQLQIPRIGGAPYYRDAMVAEHEEQEEGGTNLPSSPWLKPPFDRPFSSQVIRDSTSHKPTQLLHFFFFWNWWWRAAPAQRLTANERKRRTYSRLDRWIRWLPRGPHSHDQPFLKQARWDTSKRRRKQNVGSRIELSQSRSVIGECHQH